MYGDDAIDDLVESIEQCGFLEPLGVNSQRQVIHGDRRLRSAWARDWVRVPVRWVSYPNERSEQLAIIEHNRHRKKNGEQFIREGRLLEQIFAEEARQRQLTQGERGKEGGRGKKKTLQENFPEGFQLQPQTRDRVANAIGLGSGKLWDQLKYVAKRADAGDLEAQKVLPQINVTMSLNAAYKEAQRREILESFRSTINSGAGRRFQTSERVLYDRDGITLIHGDCMDVLRELDNDSVDLVVTDPPFNLGENYGAGINDSVPVERYGGWTRSWILECLRVLKPGGQIFSLMPYKSMRQWFCEIHDLWVEHNGHFVIWVKKMGPHLHRESTWNRVWEPILWMAKGGKPAIFHRSWHYLDDADFVFGPPAVAETEALRITKVHPTPRPSWFFRRWIELASEPGMLVVDPFLGSGTAAAVAGILGRKFVGCDLNKEWVQLSAERVMLGEDGVRCLHADLDWSPLPWDTDGLSSMIGPLRDLMVGVESAIQNGMQEYSPKEFVMTLDACQREQLKPILDRYISNFTALRATL